MTDLPDIKIKLLFGGSSVPERAYPTTSGLDLFAYRFEKLYTSDNPEGIVPSAVEKDITLPSMGRVLIHTGIAATVGPNYEIQIRPRSGLALKNGLTVLNTPGTIDEDYRGMLGVILINLSGVAQKISIRMKIAQMVVCPVVLSKVVVVSDLDETVRNAGGFGSTGV